LSAVPPSQSRGFYDESLLRRHLEQAAAKLPGPDYYVVLRWIHEILQPKTYIEIGVRHGASLRLALPDTLCLGIDPAPALIGGALPNERIFPMTSDEFFKRHDLGQALGAPSFGLAFVDGLHLWEQALQDFIHIERFAGPESVILIHDCLPLDDLTSQRNRTTDFYSGDVWKLGVCLKQRRPDLRMATVRTGPTGLCIVSRLDRKSTILESRRDEYVERYTRLIFADFETRPERSPATVGNDRDAIRSWFAEPPETRPGRDLKARISTTS
jgi:hypothetical protein